VDQAIRFLPRSAFSLLLAEETTQDSPMSCFVLRNAAIEERSFVAALLWMTAKGEVAAMHGLLGRASTKPPTVLMNAEWSTLRGDS
jgi:hypothetical protein